MLREVCAGTLLYTLFELYLIRYLTGCPEWKHWTGFWLINYVLYFFFAVRLYGAPLYENDTDR